MNKILKINGIKIDEYTYSKIVVVGEQIAFMPELQIKQRDDGKWYIYFLLNSMEVPDNAMIEESYITIPFDSKEAAYQFQLDCIERSHKIRKWMNAQ